MMSTWFPPDASFNAAEADRAFGHLFLAAAAAVLLVVGLAVLFTIRYRRAGGDPSEAPAGPVNPVLAGLWTLGAAGLAGLAFTANFAGFLDQAVAPAGSMRIEVTARQWNWDFGYPGGHLADTLRVPVGRDVQLTMRSADVAHSLAIPALRINQGVLPDRTTRTWFRADHADTFALRSHVFSGDDFGTMTSALITLWPSEYEAWLASVADIFAGRTFEEAGEILYSTKSCRACHSIDGSRIVGPSLRDAYGNTFDTVSGERIVADEAYIRESILDPNASVIAGYEAVMTPYQGTISDREIEAIIAWLKTISNAAGDSSRQEGK